MNYRGYRQQSKSSVIAELIYSKIRQFWSKNSILGPLGIQNNKNLKSKIFIVKSQISKCPSTSEIFHPNLGFKMLHVLRNSLILNFTDY